MLVQVPDTHVAPRSTSGLIYHVQLESNHTAMLEDLGLVAIQPMRPFNSLVPPCPVADLVFIQ